MTLEYLNINYCLAITLATYAATYAMNAVKNNIANTIKAELDKVKAISLSNFTIIKKEIGEITRAEFLARILLITSLTQTIIYIGAYVFSKAEKIPNSYLRGSENTMVSLCAIAIIISLISVYIVLTSPRQNLLSANWNIPE